MSLFHALAARGFVLLAATCAGQVTAAIAAGAPPPDEGPAVALLAVRLNGRPAGPPVRVLLAASGETWVRRPDVAGWRIRYPPAAVERLQDETWVALHAVDHLAYQVDERRQELVVTAAAPALEVRRLAGREERAGRPQPSPPAAFLNYDLTARADDHGEPVSGLFELGFAFRDQLARSTFVAGAGRVERLETTWTLELPDRLASWRIGDAVTAGGLVSRPVRFAGVQRSTNFRVRPDFVTYPLPALRGEAGLPSVVELWVDGALRFHQQTGAGPFEITDPPLLNGAGQVDLVIRDLQGRERRISQPFHVSTELLSRGLVESSFQAGFVREGFGSGEDRYGRFFLAADYRRGLTDRLTSELHAEVLDGQGSLGLATSFLAGRLGLVSLAAAWGGSSQSSGFSGTVAFEHRSRRLRVGIESTHAGPGFVQLGTPPASGTGFRAAPRSQTRLHVGTSRGRWGSLAAGYLHRRPAEGPPAEVVSLSFTRRLGDRFFLRVGAQQTMSSAERRRWSVAVTRSFGRRLVATGRVRSEDGETRTGLRLDRRTPRGAGLGFSVAVEEGAERRLEASATLKTRVGSYRLDLGHAGGRTGARLNASGALAWLGGALAWTRRIDQSFATVRLAGFSGVRIYADHQLVARTDSRGRAFLPDLRPYRVNLVRVESEDLPLSAQLDAVELRAIPFEGGGLVLDFPVRVERGVILRLVRENGEVVPPAAVAELAGRDEEWVVGYGGELYLPSVSPGDRLAVRWPGGACSAGLEPPPDGDLLPVVGPVVCRSR